MRLVYLMVMALSVSFVKAVTVSLVKKRKNNNKIFTGII